MTEIEGDLPFFEGVKVSAILRRRVLGWLRYAWLIAYLVVALGAVCGIWLASRADEMPDGLVWLSVALFLVVALGLFVVVSRLIRRAVWRRWYARGVPRMGHAKIIITPEALRIEAQTAITIAPWRYVSEFIAHPRYLLFVVAGMTYFVPRRFFASREQEVGFTTEALARLTPEACARSRVPAPSRWTGA